MLTVDSDGTERVLVDPIVDRPAAVRRRSTPGSRHKEGDLLAYQLSDGGTEESVLRVLDVATGQDVDGPIDRARYSPIAWLPGRQGVLLRPAAAPERRAGRRGAVPPPGLAAPGRHRPGRGRRDLRRRPGQDQLLRRVGQPRRALADASRAAQGTAPRNDVWLAELHDVRRSRRRELEPVQEGVDARTVPARRPRRPAVRVHRPGRAAGTAGGHRPDRAGVRRLARPAGRGPEAVLEDYAILDGPSSTGRCCCAAWTRHAVGEITVHDLAHRRAAWTSRRCPAWAGRRTVRTARGRPRGLVRLHRPHARRPAC